MVVLDDNGRQSEQPKGNYNQNTQAIKAKMRTIVKNINTNIPVAIAAAVPRKVAGTVVVFLYV
ncbi:hypothetical protein BOTNAR_0051g00310 [Botryotinia narcissicola]|uniref:Uncharacterized protein n=1 Tax=Botryotinia narcissicola TaxID=278944 RepID=A0A4Z1J028_9HELO|nr:hypothetical protein BOTNAR_0051g00310 [Botryotinia narcissicola]